MKRLCDFLENIFEKKLFFYIVMTLKTKQTKYVFFKKKKLLLQKKKTSKTPYILSIIGVVGICFLGVYVVNAISQLHFKVFDFAAPNTPGAVLDFTNPGSNSQEGQLEEEEIRYILLTWRGWWNHDAPDLTDTIILLGIHPSSETLTLFSIPRDLYVEYPQSGKTGKINRIYETFLSLWKDVAIERLKTKITEITGKEIDHHVNIDFKGFIEIVDILGWVEITLEKNFVDYEYPDGNLGYKTFILRKGTWTLDGEVALMYARSRHSTSDFDRSLRQQEIIWSLREKVSNLWYFKDRKTLLQMYEVFSDYIETDLTLSEMIQLWLMIKSWDSSSTLSFNLNDSCYDGSPICSTWGFLYVPLREYFGGASVLLPNGASSKDLSNYDSLKEYTQMIYENTDMYKDPKNIVIFNATRIPLLAWELAEKLRPYGFSIDREIGTKTLREKKFEKSILYYNGIDENDTTLKALSSFIDIEMVEVDLPLYSPTGTHIEIILADGDSF